MDIQNILSELRAEFSRISHAIAALEGLFSSAPRRGRPPKSKTAAPAPSKKRRTMSAAARKRISEAMKQRWVKWKGKSAPTQVKAAPKKPSRRPHMSAAAKKRLSELMKARWAERKRAKP
jgi:hypothetical protein